MTTDTLNRAADWIQILAFSVAVLVGISYFVLNIIFTRRIVTELKNQKNVAGGKRTMLHMRAATGLSEDQLFRLTWKHPRVEIGRVPDEGNSKWVNFTYVPPPPPEKGAPLSKWLDLWLYKG